MHSEKEIIKYLNSLNGRTVAIVYTYEGDIPNGAEHFYIWKSSVISKWMIAIQNLHCMPFVVDVRTFVQKAMSNTLPPIDFVINLNTGIYNLSSMALIPSVCSSMNIPCIPCNASTITIGENKEISNLVAKAINIKVPKTLNYTDQNGIFRPINLGNSIGVKRNFDYQKKGIYQEFIDGYEITTPLVFNPIKGEMDVLPTVIFYPNNEDSQWFYNKSNKTHQKGYKFVIADLDYQLKEKYVELTNKLAIQTYCRIDARVKCKNINSNNNKIFTLKDTYFIEINVMPTIRENNSFNYSFNNISEKSTYYQMKKILKDRLKNCDLNTFLLACAFISFSKLIETKTMY